MRKIVAIACSTGGPRALQKVVPYLNERLRCPVVIVQHMPEGFTKSLAERLNEQCPLPVKESINGETLMDNHVYFAKAGKHMKISRLGNIHKIVHSDEPDREGVKPCANYMYESLANSLYQEIICVVLTGMGADGSEGLKYLEQHKNIKVIIQNKETCAVFGMPGSVKRNNIPCEEFPIEEIGNEILKAVEG